MFSGRGRRYEFNVEHGGEQKKWTTFFIHEEDMKSFSTDLLNKHLQEKCKFSNNVLNIKYMDSDKDWIDLRCSDFESLVDMVESAEIVPDREDILRVTLKVSNIASPLSQPNEVSSKRLYSPSPTSKQNVSKRRTRLKLTHHEITTLYHLLTMTEDPRKQNSTYLPRRYILQSWKRRNNNYRRW